MMPHGLLCCPECNVVMDPDINAASDLETWVKHELEGKPAPAYRLQGESKRQRQKKRKGVARARPGNDALMEHSRRRLLVGVQTLAEASVPNMGFHMPPPRVKRDWLATPL